MDTDNNVVKARDGGLGRGGQRGELWGISVILSKIKNKFKSIKINKIIYGHVALFG